MYAFLISYILQLHISCAGPEIFIREGPGPSDRVLTTFLLSNHRLKTQRESSIASRGDGSKPAFLRKPKVTYHFSRGWDGVSGLSCMFICI